MERPQTKLALQRLFTPKGGRPKDVWCGDDWPGEKKGPSYWKTYCSKDTLLWEFTQGEAFTDNEWADISTQLRPVKAQGKRKDLDFVKEALDAGQSTRDIVMGSNEGFRAGARYLAFMERYRGMLAQTTEFKAKEVYVYYGATGTGKTRKAFEDAGGMNPDTVWRWVPGMGATFFEGYCGQKTVIFDEFRGQLTFGQLLVLLDGYPTSVQIKGSSVAWGPDKIYMTSPVHPKEWYQSKGDDSIAQLLRRITKVVRFDTIA